MKQILFLTNVIPFPGNSGGTKKTKKIIDILLNNDFSIDLFCLVLPDYSQKNIDDFLTQYKNKNIRISYFYNYNNSRSLKNFIKSIFNFTPLNVYRNYSQELRRKLFFNLKKQYDFIFCDHVEMFQYIKKEYYDRLILHEHNAEYMIWYRYGKVINNFILRFGVLFEAWRYKKYEQYCCKKSRMILAAPNDINMLRTKEESDFRRTYHLGNDDLLKLNNLKYSKDNFRLLFIGTMTWESNVDGINWFINKILPFIIDKYPTVTVDVIGKYTDKNHLIKHSNVIYHGFVDDLDVFFQDCNIFVCPLRFGSGMKVKVIEAMYRGIPIVTTSVGAESINLTDGENAFIADNPQDFANKVNTLFKDEKLWYNFSNKSRMIAKAEYAWKDEINRILSHIKSLYN